jgi:endonuclease/exonuclease/phosphatase family metal-dependent hydrolase
MNTPCHLQPGRKLKSGLLAPLLACSILLYAAECPAAAALGHGEGTLRVMTYNVDEGTDYIELLSATTLSQFLVAVGQTITQVRATDPPTRMQAVARQIIAAGAQLVSLQEVDLWMTGAFDPRTETCGPVSVEFDMLAELLDALAAQGGHYQVAVKRLQFAFPPTPGVIPPSTLLCAAVENFNVILARTDINSNQFQWDNAQSGEFTAQTVVPTPIGPIPLPVVWVSVDAQFHRRPFRFIGTHLDSIVAAVRQAQGAELRGGPADTSLPVVIAMDSNAQAFPPPQDPAYLDFVAAGYDDAWAEIFPNQPGLTCCQAQFVNNPVSQLTQRIDLILTLGEIDAQAIALFGADQASKTAGGLWPSDHAGVAARLQLGRE